MQAREEEKFQAHAVSGMPGSGQLPFLGLQDSPGSSAPLNMGSSLFVAKATGAAHDGRCSRRKCPAPPDVLAKSEAPGMGADAPAAKAGAKAAVLRRPQGKDKWHDCLSTHRPLAPIANPSAFPILPILFARPGPACSTFEPDLTSGAEWWPNLSDLTAGCGPGACAADSRRIHPRQRGSPPAAQPLRRCGVAGQCPLRVLQAPIEHFLCIDQLLRGVFRLTRDAVELRRVTPQIAEQGRRGCEVH